MKLFIISPRLFLYKLYSGDDFIRLIDILKNGQVLSFSGKHDNGDLRVLFIISTFQKTGGRKT